MNYVHLFNVINSRQAFQVHVQANTLYSICFVSDLALNSFQFWTLHKSFPFKNFRTKMPLIPKLAMIDLRVHYEPLNSDWSIKCECVMEFLFSCKLLCTVTFGIRRCKRSELRKILVFLDAYTIKELLLEWKPEIAIEAMDNIQMPEFELSEYSAAECPKDTGKYATGALRITRK